MLILRTYLKVQLIINNYIKKHYIDLYMSEEYTVLITRDQLKQLLRQIK